jgi:ABC-2 type transporter
MRNLYTLFKDLVSKRKLILDLAKADFKKRFVGSYFGIAWMFVQPIVTVVIYFAIFQIGFKSTPPVPVPYVLWLVPGIVPWFFFAEALNSGVGVLSEYNYLVKKVVFNVEILPFIKLVSCLLTHGIFIIIMFLMFFCFGKFPRISWIQIIYYTFAMSVFTLGLTYIACAINVFFKDMAQIVGICLQFGMWLTPIMWSPETFGNFPSWAEKLLKINPMHYIVYGYRDSMLQGNLFIERPIQTVYFWVVTLIILILGLKVFNKLRPHFSDVL